MTEPEPGVAVVTLRLRVNRVPAEVFLTALTTIGKEAQVAVDALTKICEQIETIGELVEGDLFEQVEEVPPGSMGVDLGAPEGDRTGQFAVSPSAPPPPPPPSPPPVSKEPHLPEAEVPDDAPEWLAPALKRVKAAKTRTILKLLASDGDVTVQSVIYAFRPPIKETYAAGILSDCKAVLGQVGWTLERDNTGAYRARIKQ